MTIRLVTFDALHTLLTLRLPVYVQYSQTFEPYLGQLDPDALKRSFKTALKQIQSEKPVYQSGAEDWWGEVIKRTAVGAGAEPQVVEQSLGEIVPRLLHRFASKEGYKMFDDSFSCLQELRRMDVKTAIISNTDMRMRRVLGELNVLSHIEFALLSEEQKIEKPTKEIFLRACKRAGVEPSQTLHVGDELKADYYGAKASGFAAALLLRRPGPDGEGEAKEVGEDLSRVDVVHGLGEVVEWVRKCNV